MGEKKAIKIGEKKKRTKGDDKKEKRGKKDKKAKEEKPTKKERKSSTDKKKERSKSSRSLKTEAVAEEEGQGGWYQFGRVYYFEYLPTGFFSRVMARIFSSEEFSVKGYWRNGLYTTCVRIRKESDIVSLLSIFILTGIRANFIGGITRRKYSQATNKEAREKRPAGAARRSQSLRSSSLHLLCS